MANMPNPNMRDDILYREELHCLLALLNQAMDSEPFRATGNPGVRRALLGLGHLHEKLSAMLEAAPRAPSAGAPAGGG